MLDTNDKIKEAGLLALNEMLIDDTVCDDCVDVLIEEYMKL